MYVISETYLESPVTLELSDGQLRAHLGLLTWCLRRGAPYTWRVPRSAARRLVDPHTLPGLERQGGVVTDGDGYLLAVDGCVRVEIESRSSRDRVEIESRSSRDRVEIESRSSRDRPEIESRSRGPRIPTPGNTSIRARPRVGSDLPDLPPDPDPILFLRTTTAPKDLTGCAGASAPAPAQSATAPEPEAAAAGPGPEATATAEAEAAAAEGAKAPGIPEPEATAEPAPASPAPRTDRAPASLDAALAMPIAARAEAVRAHEHEADWSQPERWPEVIEIATAMAEANGRTPGRLGRYSRDAGVRAVVDLLATGYSVVDLVRVCRLLPRSGWWHASSRGLSSLTPEVARRTLSEAPERSIVETPEFLAECKQVREMERLHRERLEQAPKQRLEQPQEQSAPPAPVTGAPPAAVDPSPGDYRALVAGLLSGMAAPVTGTPPPTRGRSRKRSAPSTRASQIPIAERQAIARQRLAEWLATEGETNATKDETDAS